MASRVDNLLDNPWTAVTAAELVDDEVGVGCGYCCFSVLIGDCDDSIVQPCACVNT